MTEYPRILRRDPARGHLLQLGVFHGYKGVAGPFCAITPAERDRLCEILAEEAQDIVCLNCGCTKSDRWIAAQGMASCCEARAVVPAAEAVRDLQELRKHAKPTRPDLRLRWLADEIAAGRGVNRTSLMREFGCSRDTASRDIAKLIASNPDLLVYDASQKVHRTTAPAGKKAA